MFILYVILGLIIVIILGVLFVIYNSLITVKNNISKAWADIDVLLQQRHDMLGKLIDAVSGYMKYEKGVMTSITQLRTAWMQTLNTDVQSKINNSNQVSSALKSIFAVAENYPDLKADNSFIQLQQSITSVETQIADRREYYNNSVNLFNIRIQQIPYNIVAKMVGYKTMPMFNVPQEEKQDVKITFN